VHKTIAEELSLARDPNTPVDVLRELSKNINWLVRLHVVKNPSTPIDVLRALAQDDDDMVRRQVALNPKSSSEILITIFEYEKSLKYPDDDIITALYYNAHLPYVAKVIIETLFGEILS